MKKLAGAVLVVLLVGCSSAGATSSEEIHYDRIDLPDAVDTPDVVTFCDHGHRLYQSERTGGDGGGMALAVVPNDPTCLR